MRAPPRNPQPTPTHPGMQIVLPSVAMIVALAFGAMHLYPRMSGAALVVASVALLAISLYLHRRQFGQEYRQSSWQESLRTFGPISLVAAAIILALLYRIVTDGSGPYVGGPTTSGGNNSNVRNAGVGGGVWAALGAAASAASGTAGFSSANEDENEKNGGVNGALAQLTNTVSSLTGNNNGNNGNSGNSGNNSRRPAANNGMFDNLTPSFFKGSNAGSR